MNKFWSTRFAARLTANQFFAHRPLLAVSMSLTLLIYGAIGAVGGEMAEKVRYLLLLGSVWAFFAIPEKLRRSTAFWLLLAAVMVGLLSWGASLLTHPHWAESSPKVNRTANWLALIPMAFAIGGYQRRGLLVWGLAAVALLLAPWLLGDGWPEISRGLQGERVDFRLHNAEHAGLYYAVAGLGLLILAPRVLRVTRLKPLAVLLWSIAFIGAATGIVITQTRSIWLAVTLALMLFGWLQGFRLIQHRLWRWVSAAALMLVVIPLTLMFANIDAVENRVASEQATVTSLLAGAYEDIPFNSIGIRIHSWHASLDWLAQRPLLGWGGNGRTLVIAESAQFPAEVKQNFRHLHNSYLDVAVNYGGIGVTLLLLLWGWLIFAALQAARRGYLSEDVLQFFLCFMLLWVTVNCFESFVFYTSGIYVFSLVSGLILSCYWRSTLQRDAIAIAASEQTPPVNELSNREP